MTAKDSRTRSPYDILAEHGLNEYRLGRTRNLRDFAAEEGIDLDADERSFLIRDLILELEHVATGSSVVLRGSLAEGRADAYSDIDLLWDVPDDKFLFAIDGLEETLARVRPVASLRFDPDVQRSATRRRVFIRFADVPLFWRVDLDVFARSADRDPDCDRDNPAARGSEWSATESALMNAVAAIKADRRGQATTAADLLSRAERRVGANVTHGDVPQRVLTLVDTIAGLDPATSSLAMEIRRILAEAPQ